MKLVDLIKRSGRNLRHAKTRTLLTASAIAVGGFTLTLTLGAATGARQYSNQLIAANFDPNTVAVAKDKGVFGEGGGSGPREYDESLGSMYGSQFKLLDQKDLAKFSAMPHVDWVLPAYSTDAQFITRDGAKKYTGALNVYDPGQKPETLAGAIPDRELADGNVILPEEYVELLHFKSPKDAVGKTITAQVRQATGQTKAFDFTVAAVSTKSALQLDFAPAGLSLSPHDARAVNDFANQGTVMQGKVLAASLVAKGVGPDELQQELKDAGYQAVTSKDAQKFLNQIIDMLQVIILVFGFVTLIASFFGVVNTQYISVLERTREIGLMKALGMSKRAVSRLFMLEATWIGFLGALLGSAGAIALGSAFNPWISEQLHFEDQRLLVFAPLQIAGLIVFLMLVTTIAGLLPARKAAKLDPIEALRTE